MIINFTRICTIFMVFALFACSTSKTIVIKSEEDLTIVLRAAKSIPMQYAVEILDLAYRNNYKIVIATQPN